MSQTKTITIGTAVLGVSYPDGNSEFSTPNTLMSSYADPALAIENDTQSPTLNWNGIPISVTQFYDPTVDDATGDVVGNFFAIDVIEEAEAGSLLSELDDPGIPGYVTWNGNKLEASLIDGRYYLTFEDTGETATPSNKITFQGTPQATGISDELILNDSGFTTSDIDTDPNNGGLDLKSISLGGVPITVGRVGFKYYLIIKKITFVPAIPSADLTSAIISQWKYNDDYTDSQGAYNASPFGSPVFTGGQINNAIDLTSGSLIYLSGEISELNNVSTFEASFSFWMKTIDSDGMIFDHYNSNTTTSGFKISVESNKLKFYVESTVAESSTAVSTNDVDTGEWVFVVINYNIGGNSTIYINNSPDGSVASGVFGAIDSDGAYPTWGQDDPDSGSSPDNEYTGLLDNFCIFNRILTTDERTFLWYNGDGTEELSN